MVTWVAAVNIVRPTLRCFGLGCAANNFFMFFFFSFVFFLTFSDIRPGTTGIINGIRSEHPSCGSVKCIALVVLCSVMISRPFQRNAVRHPEIEIYYCESDNITALLRTARHGT